jgi:hypothetical protein
MFSSTTASTIMLDPEPPTVVEAEAAEVDVEAAEVERATELFTSDSSMASSDDDCGLFDVPTAAVEGEEEEEEEDIVLPGTNRFEQLFGGLKAKGRGKGKKASLQLKRCSRKLDGQAIRTPLAVSDRSSSSGPAGRWRQEGKDRLQFAREQQQQPTSGRLRRRNGLTANGKWQMQAVRFGKRRMRPSLAIAGHCRPLPAMTKAEGGE